MICEARNKKMYIFPTDTGFACIYQDSMVEGGTRDEVAMKIMREIALFNRAVSKVEEVAFKFYQVNDERIGMN